MDPRTERQELREARSVAPGLTPAFDPSQVRLSLGGSLPSVARFHFTERQHTTFFLHAGQAAAFSIDNRTVCGERYPWRSISHSPLYVSIH